MKPYSVPYLPLTSSGRHAPRKPDAAPNARRWSWRYAVLAIGGFSNIIFGLVWWHNHLHSGFPPLDDYQILKEDYQLVAASQPNATAIVSSLYNDLYLLPILTLGHSISKHYGDYPTSPSRPSPQLLLLYIPGRISAPTLCLARAVGWTPHPVTHIKPPHGGKGVYHRFADQYTKLALWTLDQIGIERAVYLDGDTLVRRRFDELFALPFRFAAVPDVEAKDPGFSLGFNAGVLALQPSTAVFESLLAHMDIARFPLRMAEQAYLNYYFGAQVVKLPHVYNANLAIKLRSLRLWDFMRRSDAIRIVHYTTPKPFDVNPRSEGESTGMASGKELLRNAREKTWVMGEAKRSHGGVYEEEIGWWEEVWKEMERERKDDFERCA